MHDFYKNLLITALVGLSVMMILMGKACQGSPGLSDEELSLDSSGIVSLRQSTSSLDIDVKLARMLFFENSFSTIEGTEDREGELRTIGLETFSEVLDSLSSRSTLLEERPDVPWKKTRIGAAFVLGSASGAAMTPIFLQSLESLAESLGSPLENNSPASLSIRYGTMALLVGDGILNNLSILLDEREHRRGKYHGVGKFILISSSLLPVSFLWNVESAHRQSAGSTGFDAYMTVFSLGSVPLLLSSYLYSRQTVFEMSQDEMPLSRREKAIAYGLPLLNTVARGVMAYALFNEALSIVSPEEEVNQAVSIIAGCMAANVMGIFQEINGFKQLVFQHRAKEPWSLKGMMTKTALLAVNGYKSLPSAAVIFYGMKNFPQTLRGVLAAQFFATHGVSATGNALGFLQKRT